VVIGDPLPASARQFTDLYVSPGQNYWYRLVAVDKNGNHSDPTSADGGAHRGALGSAHAVSFSPLFLLDSHSAAGRY
jgi:hypothetical protein